MKFQFGLFLLLLLTELNLFYGGFKCINAPDDEIIKISNQLALKKGTKQATVADIKKTQLELEEKILNLADENIKKAYKEALEELANTVGKVFGKGAISKINGFSDNIASLLNQYKFNGRNF